MKKNVLSAVLCIAVVIVALFLLPANANAAEDHECSAYGEWIVSKQPTFTSQGKCYLVCSRCGEVVTETVDKLVGKVRQWNITLAGDFKVNFYLDISQSIQNTARVKILVGDKVTTYNVSELPKNQFELYHIAADISAAQMNEDIVVTVMNGGEIGSTATYSVQKYCNRILSASSYSQYHAVVKEMLHYGAMAQIYFDYNKDNLVNAGITGAALKSIPETTEDLSVNDGIDSLDFYGASLVYRDRIAVRYYFTGNVTGCSFIADGNSCTPVKKDGIYYIEVADILPQHIDRQITLTVMDKQGNRLSVSYSPMNYIVRMNRQGDKNRQNLLKALYNYHLASKVFAGSSEIIQPEIPAEPDIMKIEYALTIEPVTFFNAYLQNDSGNVQYITAYSNSDGTTYVELVGPITKKGTLGGKAITVITYYLEHSGMLELNGDCVYGEGDSWASIYVTYGEENYLMADYSGKIPDKYIASYQILEYCFKELTENMPDYIPAPYESGMVSEYDKMAMNEILAQMDIENIDAYIIENVEIDDPDTFYFVTGLTSFEGVETCVSFTPMILTIPYSMVVITLTDADYAGLVAKDFVNNIDWYKWVFVFPSNAVVAVKGDQVICLVASSDLYNQTYNAIRQTGWKIVATLDNPNM